MEDIELRVIAMYLPQFHRVPENDKWWGEGFTEWKAVKSGKNYYECQVQPRVPYNDFYYDLMDKNTMKWQAALMHEYGVDGMCFYHYYFKDGKKILERPAENLLEWKDIDMPFCFSWANETWARSWSKLRNTNSWSIQEEKTSESEGNAILLEQAYGNENDWKTHFDYLLKFFKDERYIKIDNKPVFIFYKPFDISCLSKMVLCWKKLATEAGLEGLFLIGVNCGKMNEFDAVLEQEPQNTIRANGNHVFDTRSFWNEILGRPINRSIKTYYCGVPGYDDTPRRGKNGVLLSSTDPIDFENGMTMLFERSYALGNELVFVNAWNEWGEGMYLEPDALNGYGMLEALRNAKEKAEHQNVNTAFTNIVNSGEIAKVDRYHSYWVTFDKWLSVLENGSTISDYLISNGIKRVGIYGLGMSGKHLISQLEKSEIEIGFGVDRKKIEEKMEFDVYCIDDEIPKADLIIVSVTYDFASIYEELSMKTDCEIVSINELLDNILSGEKLRS